ncbi:hypothetical protein PENANT_c056G11125 [Penicillium antarcticum]|uniref:SMP-30/Gluconolactonase/LRE-like region domain-containing protein n=1 Tax=Penicillium antarcticum TaxID=416450 RepID=A0A1V6PRC2_9EURO|nr:uncharacterized protein N7508_011146 [Penicillium antarcticum]XP_058314202.1 uncharacterized protein N7508_011164 [Penicillium antarcticum]KAJ5288371.1 hypothetical protein N7508_011146 [Penicillium antarcticum]KAJ5288389.1 hypothetical protein N7508_011164 [Penicillium antarcticum]OQD79252.1 hypothetical protein PENANT_c056G11125 [Penicillium antarcticum]
MGYPWWAGLHDLVPLPGQRKFLVSEDRGLHAFDTEAGQLTEHYENVTHKYLPGLEVTTGDRHGYAGNGKWEELPQSDLKSFNIAPDGSFVYAQSVQSLWIKIRGFHTSLVVDSRRRKMIIGDEIYRPRWFGELDGWSKP